jgi:SusD family.
MKTKALYLIAALGLVVLGFSSCDEPFPTDELNSEVLLSSESGIEYVLDGCYAMLKDEYEYVEYASSNTYVRHYLQDAEFPSDNICLSGQTSDPLAKATWYKMTDHLKNIELPWWIGYKVIFTANTVIETVEKRQPTAEERSAATNQLLGEAYFLRGMIHFHLVNLFGRQYTLGRDNLGIPLRVSTNTNETTRATVGEVYDQVVLDLRKAADLMNAPRHATDNPGAYATKNTALGLLSRVYLYMEENQKVLDVIAEMGDPVSHLDSDYANYFAKAPTSKETLLCIYHSPLNENRGQSSIGSMYTAAGGGWGEVYASDPLMNLYERYPEDIRLSYIQLQIEVDDRQPLKNKPVVFFPVKSSDDYRSNLYAEILTDGEGKYCELEGTKYRINERKVNGMNEPDDAGEYTVYYVTYGGEECPARLYDKFPIHRNTYPNYFITKFSYQDGEPMLSSPVFLRWGEIVLNRAEAEAKLGKNVEALDDVNVMRTRAGIPAAGMFAVGNMHGYASVLDVVLDERRMELAFEGHRRNDVYRNKRDMDRRYAGTQPWEVIPYTADKIQYPIPYNEYTVSGIPQNPGY